MMVIFLNAVAESMLSSINSASTYDRDSRSLTCMFKFVVESVFPAEEEINNEVTLEPTIGK
jgi:hypothetical protein